MNLIRLVLGCAVVMGFLFACHRKERPDTDNAANEWAEMDAFHLTMADAYHPFKDSTNLKPAKDLASNLADEATTWAASKRPKEADSEELTDKLTKLKTDCRTFSDHVKEGSADAELGKELTGLHGQFHSIMESLHTKTEMNHD